MRTAKICLAGAAAAAMVGFLAAPAAAAPTDTTTTTFEVLVGTLDIDAPATADLGDGATGGVITGQLGAVTVDDSRGAADASWVASVTASVFQTGGGSPPETVLPAEIDYWSGPAVDGDHRRRHLHAGAAHRRRRRTAVQRHSAHRLHPHRRHRRQHRQLEPHPGGERPAGQHRGHLHGTVTHSVA